MHIWERWFDWRCEQAGIPSKGGSHNEAWLEVLQSMPELYGWYPYEEDGTIMRLTWKDENGKHEEVVAMSEFVDDIDEQPDLKMLWHSNYWDGPLSGMCTWEGKPYLFNIYYADEEEDYLDFRRYGLYEMTPEEEAELFHQHHEFEKDVGYHCNYGENYDDYGIREDELPKWCPLWLYQKYRRFKLWRYYNWTSKRFKKVSPSENREPVVIFAECQFQRKRRKTNT